MAANENSVSVSQPIIPIFKEENYEFWSIKMKTLFKSQNLWDLVEHGFADLGEEGRLKKNKKKDANALFFIQDAVRESVFSQIVTIATSMEAWSTLQKLFQESSKVLCKCCVPRNLDTKAMTLFDMLGRHKWDVKVLLVLPAFATSYGEF